MVNPRVFLDFAIDGTSVGRVIFELYSVSAPKTTENFRSLCTGERGVSPKSHIPLYYKHSKMHRVIQDFMVQGGDFTKGNGIGGESIYGGPFADEDLSRPVDQPGLLCMANKGPNTNNSQFFITLRPCPHLTGKHVVFGRVIRGFDDVVLKQIANVSTDEKDRPTVPVEIINCGELQLVKRPASAAAAGADASKERESEESESEEERGRKKRKRRVHSSSRSLSPSLSRSVSRSHSPIRSISRSRPRSPTPESRSERSDSEADHKRRSSSKKRKHRKDKNEKKYKKRKSHRRRSPSSSSSRSRSASYERALNNGHTSIPRQETEEEYDARLEREERERIEEARRRELAEIKKRYEAEQARKEAGAGVRFKGRGRMKFIDPELHSRRKN
ncbi:hypothetical protein ACEPAG_7385 [Sanghuangporus baumii]